MFAAPSALWRLLGHTGGNDRPSRRFGVTLTSVLVAVGGSRSGAGRDTVPGSEISNSSTPHSSTRTGRRGRRA
jgi:hypothetical protein